MSGYDSSNSDDRRGPGRKQRACRRGRSRSRSRRRSRGLDDPPVYSIGRSEGRAWGNALGRYLRGRHTAAAGDGGAGAVSKKCNILTPVTGERVDEAMGWEAETHRNDIPYYASDGDIAYCAWETSSSEAIMTGIGIYFEADDDGEKAEEDLFSMYRCSYEAVRDLNFRLWGQLARCPNVDRDDTRCRLFYVNLFQGCRSTSSGPGQGVIPSSFWLRKLPSLSALPLAGAAARKSSAQSRPLLARAGHPKRRSQRRRRRSPDPATQAVAIMPRHPISMMHAWRRAPSLQLTLLATHQRPDCPAALPSRLPRLPSTLPALQPLQPPQTTVFYS